MSYFTRNGSTVAKPHQYVQEYAGHNGRKSAKAFMKKSNRRFIRRNAKIECEECG